MLGGGQVHPLPYMVGKYLRRGGVGDISLPRKWSPHVASRGWAHAGRGHSEVHLAEVCTGTQMTFYMWARTVNYRPHSF